MRAPGPPRGGYSFVELVVASVVLQLGLLGALAVLVLAERSTARAERLGWAVVVASGILDSLETADSVVAGGADEDGLGIEWMLADGEVVVWIDAGAAAGPADTLRFWGWPRGGLRAP